MTEFGFIEQIRTRFASLPDNGFEGIGDDCAVLPIGGGESLIFTADLLTRASTSCAPPLRPGNWEANPLP